MPSKNDRTIVITGRGRTGKSTFIVLMARFLNELGWKPLLIVDSDPDESLSDMLGIDVKKEGMKTISEMLYEILDTQTMSKMRGDDRFRQD
jgi:CO dehydrogenase maturation factor